LLAKKDFDFELAVFLVVEGLEKAPEGSAVRHAEYAEAQVVRTVVEAISWVV
jgi:hypothetical protein